MLLDGIHHLRTEHAMSERRIAQSDRAAGDRGERRDGESEKCERKCFAENARIRFRVKADQAVHSGTPAHVNEVMRAPQKLIEIHGERPAGGIFARRRQVRCRLAI